MDNKIVRIPVGPAGELRPARELQFETVGEPWSEYRLLDGGSIRLRATAMKIFRVVDESGKPQFTPNGEPFIVVTAGQQLVANE